ncbi:serine/threonine protein kinase [Streptomyces sp. CNQ-509]|uniref:serine/threonine-protein kinase n=1 Tax=Streptomyces sp. CNQ-509 TaxID=444103 RepID=UPI00062DEBD8|nr:serine/threonine-protein kinase [Streptomyces sp. CNQ-509]AKH80850.1 serine/threonine protein kinase [Streptomyces sp. CNQ-509]
MAETDPAHPWTDELSAADLEQLGVEPLRRTDPVTVGPYRVLARLGGGGMGRLYLGREATVPSTAASRPSPPATAGGPAPETGDDESVAYGAGSLVAVKTIRPEYVEDAPFRRRFEREVAAVRRVHGRYTASLLGSGFDNDEHLWMATAYVPGLSLEDTVRRFGSLSAPVVWRLASEVGQALTSIAAVGIVHRDLKPSNVLLGQDGARVIDFGVSHTADASALTVTGQHLGTPAFMSPEQADGGRVGTASDVFSLGSVLALAATRRAPFGGESAGEVIHRVIYSEPSAEVLEEVASADPALADLISRCLDKDATRRPTPQQIVNAVHAQASAAQWPATVNDLIEARTAWVGRTASVPQADQLTVLRRAAPAHTPRPRKHGRRRALVLSAVVAGIAAVTTVVAMAATNSHPSGTAAPSQPSSPHTSPHRTAPSPSHRSGQPSDVPESTTPTPTHTATPEPPEIVVTIPPAAPKETEEPDVTEPPAESRTPDRRPAEKPRPTTTVTSPPRPPASKPAKPWESCTFYSGTALTDYGDRGRRVSQVQCILTKRGYSVGPDGVDGDFGPNTQAAVKKFQSRHHLQVDGQVGVFTWAALRK